MKFLACLTLFAASCAAQAGCPSTLPLKGVLTVAHCDPAGGQCLQAANALYKYMDAVPDNDPEVLRLSLHGSPWHLYDGEYRILDIGELSALVRQHSNNIKRVVLLASWSGTAPDAHTKSLAQKLSTALDGMPVTGQDGFVWVSPEGKVSTTQQAFTAGMSGPYWIGKNDKVMASLVTGWALGLEAEFTKARDGAGLMRVGAAYDIFMLCPQGALKANDEGAAFNNPIAAYNAAVMRLERGEPGDAKAAMVLLKQSAGLGDKKAQAKLRALAGHAPAI